MARSLRAVQQLARQLRHAVKSDVAREARARFQEAKHAGPEQLASHFRGILKSGRRYKPPAIPPTLHAAARSFEEDSIAVLGQHFATAERGGPCTDLSALRCPARAHLPDIPEGFAGLSKKQKHQGFRRSQPKPFSVPLCAQRRSTFRCCSRRTRAVSTGMERGAGCGHRKTPQIALAARRLEIHNASGILRQRHR